MCIDDIHDENATNTGDSPGCCKRRFVYSDTFVAHLRDLWRCHLSDSADLWRQSIEFFVRFFEW